MTTSWLEVEDAADRPTEDQLAQSQQRVGFRAVPVTAPAVLDLLHTYRSLLTHGTAHLAGFDVVDDDFVTAWFLARGRHDEYPLAELLIASPAFAAAMPEVVEPGLTGPSGLEPEDPLVLDGRLGAALTWGGPYEAFEGTAAQAKALGAAFCAELFEDRYEEVRVDHSTTSWSNWFHGGPWDGTWVITDRRRHRLTVLCATDVD